MSMSQTTTKTVRDINKNFKYYKWNTNKQSNKKQTTTQPIQTTAQPTAQSTQSATQLGNQNVQPTQSGNQLTQSGNQLSLGKTYKYNLNMSFIKLYYNNERAVFQTPMLLVPYAPRKGEYSTGTGTENAAGVTSGFKESYYLSASLFNDEYDTDVGEFETWINDLEVYILKLLRKRPYLNVNAAGKTPLLKFDDYRGCQKLNLKFERGNAKFYVIEGKSRLSKSIPFNEIIMPCYAVFIIELGGVWIRKHAVNEIDTDIETEWGVSFILHGAQCTPSHTEPSPLGIQPTDFIYNKAMHNVTNNYSSQLLLTPPPPPPPPPLPPPPPPLPPPTINPILVPYLKMLKLGIPKNAVKQKMMLAGDDPLLLDNPTQNIQLISLQSTPSQQNTNITPSNTSTEPPKITPDMLTSIRLKKAEHTDISNNTPNKVVNKSTSQQGFRVELSDILNIKSRLKSRAHGNDQDSYSKIFKK